MATIGQVLSDPEAGWQRIDDTNPLISYQSSGWARLADATCWNGGMSYNNNAINAKVSFVFYGTKLRFLGVNNPTHSDKVAISIDGGPVEYFSQQGASATRHLEYEKTGLTLGKHSVEIYATNNYSVRVDAIDVDDIGYITIDVGSTLTDPQEGWKRYDDAYELLSYSGAWSKTGTTGYYNTYASYATGAGSFLEFKFYGNKIRIISKYGTDQSTNNVINIDGVDYTFSCYRNTESKVVLAFEKLDLNDQLHTIKISKGNAFLTVDAIDINSSGRLLHSQEVVNLNELTVGKRIRCHYESLSSGRAGIFSGFGKETSDFIPVTSSARPSGDFYLIATQKISDKRRMLVADRNIQHTISWDALNSEGLVLGGDIKFLNMDEELFAATSVSADTPFNKIWSNPIDVKEFHIVRTTNIADQALTEIEIFDENGLNIASQAAYYLIGSPANNTYTESYVKAVLTDGDKTKYGFDDHPSEVGDNGVRIVFPRTVKVSKIVVYGHNVYPMKTLRVRRYSPDKLEVLANLLSGGVSTTDRNNDWDNYIVNSSLNGTITRGDNLFWNWKPVASWTSSTPTGKPTIRMHRGYAAVDTYYDNRDSSYTSNTIGYRPMFIISIPFEVRSLLQVDGEYKKYDLAVPAIIEEKALIPIMTSNTVPNGVAIAGSIYNSSYDAWKAFNGSTDGEDCWATAPNTVAGWVGYKFSSTTKITAYSITARNSDIASNFSKESAPRNWTFEGSNDGTNWTVIHTVVGESGWRIGETRRYSIPANSANYNSYRVNISQNNGNASFTTIGELRMFEVRMLSSAVEEKWTTVSKTLPSEDTFINEGMRDLSVFDRKSKVLNRVLSDEVALGSGKLFKANVNLSDLVEIKTIRVKK